MKLRRKYQDMLNEFNSLMKQKDLLLTQMSDEKAEWEALHKVGG